MSKIFVRHRRHVGRGSGMPRFAIVAVEGADLKVYKTRIRKSELEKMAEEIGAEIVFLPRGEQGEGEAGFGEEASLEGRGRGRRRRKDRREDD